MHAQRADTAQIILNIETSPLSQQLRTQFCSELHFFLHTVNQFNHTNKKKRISTNLNYHSVENTEAKQE